MAMGPDNYIGAKSFPVEGGVNRFLFRSTTSPGEIKVKASAAGLEEASLTLTTKPFRVDGGLATTLPSAGLPSRLDRGPTPATPSYHHTRIPVAIVGATAGANTARAAASYDDNELTDWVNDGKIAIAWVEYTLEREARVSEITLKLNKFRSKVYPLLITVDGKEVFRGSTQTSLGYYTSKCQPRKGKKVRVQLASTAADKDTNTGVEVSGKSWMMG